MFDLIPVLLSGLVAGGIIGFVVANQRNAVAKTTTTPQPDSSSEEPPAAKLEDVARKIQSLTLMVAADVSAHQNRMEGITHDLEGSNGTVSADVIVKSVSELVAANRQMQSRLEETQRKFQEQSQLLQSTQQLANRDPLTGLANRRYLDNKLAELAQGRPNNSQHIVAMTDIDHFKSINDKYGHQAGDVVLNQFGELLNKHLGEHGVVARFGGEEFAVITEMESWREFCQLLDRTRIDVEAQRMISSDPERVVTFSCGVAILQADEDPQAWLERADQALYEAKRSGRNAVYVFDERITRFSAKTNNPNAPKSNPVATKPVTEPAVEESQAWKVDGRQSLISQLRTMANNVNLDQVQLAAVAVRLPEPELDEDQRFALLESSRKLLRSVDKVGFDDSRTMLSLMVTSGATKAEERAVQLLEQVNLALAELTPGVNRQAATVGISLLSEDSSAEQVISQAADRASKARPVVNAN